ncbi:hypothetical protein MMB232_01228 [Brevundimonas subvibrioides]
MPLFFVLSGFVIAHAYGHRLESTEQVRAFMIRRFGRLYPLHLITLLGVVALEVVKLILTRTGDTSGQAPFTGTNSLETLVANVFLLHAIIPFGVYSWNGPSWSISTEFWTYLVFAILILLSGRFRTRAVTLAATFFGGLLVVLPLFGIHLKNMTGQGILVCLFCFFLGEITYRLFRRFKDKGFIPAGGWEWLVVPLAVIPFWFEPLPAIAGPLVFAAVIFVFAFENGPGSKGLQIPALQFLGKISYSIYMIHFLVLAVINGVLRVAEGRTGINLLGPNDMIAFGPPGTMDLLALVYVAIVIGLGWFSYTFIEAPARDFFNKVADRKIYPLG